MTERVSNSGEKAATPTKKQIDGWWKIIKSSGCSDIQDAIAGRKPEDFDWEAIKWMADFVLTSPQDTQAAPKRPLR